jgi:hypothetical protein
MNTLSENYLIEDRTLLVFLTQNRGLALLSLYKPLPLMAVFEPFELGTEQDPIVSAAGICTIENTCMLHYRFATVLYVTLKGKTYCQKFKMRRDHTRLFTDTGGFSISKKIEVPYSSEGVLPHRTLCFGSRDLAVMDFDKNCYKLEYTRETNEMILRQTTRFTEKKPLAFQSSSITTSSDFDLCNDRDSILDSTFIDPVLRSEKENIELISADPSGSKIAVAFTTGDFEIWERESKTSYDSRVFVRRKEEKCSANSFRGEVSHITCTKTNYYVIFNSGYMYIGHYDNPKQNQFVMNYKFLVPIDRDQPSYMKWRTVFKWLFIGRSDPNSNLHVFPIEIIYNCLRVY